jgi:hypothetical protein
MKSKSTVSTTLEYIDEIDNKKFADIVASPILDISRADEALHLSKKSGDIQSFKEYKT